MMRDSKKITHSPILMLVLSRHRSQRCSGHEKRWVRVQQRERIQAPLFLVSSCSGQPLRLSSLNLPACRLGGNYSAHCCC